MKPLLLAGLILALPAQAAAGPLAKREAVRQSFIALAAATPETRSRLRFEHARTLLDAGRAEEALGVLGAIERGDAAAARLPQFQLAAARAAFDAKQAKRALSRLTGLERKGEACVLALLAKDQLRLTIDEDALVPCAMEASGALGLRRAHAARIAAARHHLARQEHSQAIALLAGARKRTPTEELLLGRAHSLAGDRAAALNALARAAKDGDGDIRQHATALLVAQQRALGRIDPRAAVGRLDAERFAARGGEGERALLDALRRAAAEAGQTRTALAAGAALLRHFDLGPAGAPLADELRAMLAAALAPPNRPIGEAASLFWENRDLLPQGESGDELVRRLGQRLATAGLHERGADILLHQARSRADALAAGVLGAQAAAWYLLAAKPRQALEALEATGVAEAPEDVRARRRRLEIAALISADRGDAAGALIEAEPAIDKVFAAEAWWRIGRMDRLAEVASDLASVAGQPPAELVLKHAVALVRLGRVAELNALARRRGPGMAGRPGADALAMLAAPPETIGPAQLAAALKALPTPGEDGALVPLAVCGAATPSGCEAA